MAEDEKKRHQHYVWWNYLLPWATNNKFVYCLRRKDGKIIPGGRTSVANERDFYRLVELRPEEVAFVFKLAVERSVAMLRPIHTGWLQAFTYLFEVRDKLLSSGVPAADIEERLDVAANNLEENLHAEMEGKAIPLLESVLAGDIQFLGTEDGCRDFMLYLSTQYFRTKRMRESVASSVGVKHEETIRRVWGVLKHIYGTNMGWALFSQREAFKYVLIENPTELEFITGDQPVVNTYATHAEAKIVDKLEFYYPVSPTKALLVGRRGEGEPAIQRKTLTEAEVRSYNDHIAIQSHEQLYARSELSLEPYLQKAASPGSLGGGTVAD